MERENNRRTATNGNNEEQKRTKEKEPKNATNRLSVSVCFCVGAGSE